MVGAAGLGIKNGELRIQNWGARSAWADLIHPRGKPVGVLGRIGATGSRRMRQFLVVFAPYPAEERLAAFRLFHPLFHGQGLRPAIHGSQEDLKPIRSSAGIALMAGPMVQEAFIWIGGFADVEAVDGGAIEDVDVVHLGTAIVLPGQGSNLFRGVVSTLCRSRSSPPCAALLPPCARFPP